MTLNFSKHHTKFLTPHFSSFLTCVEQEMDLKSLGLEVETFLKGSLVVSSPPVNSHQPKRILKGILKNDEIST